MTKWVKIDVFRLQVIITTAESIMAHISPGGGDDLDRGVQIKRPFPHILTLNYSSGDQESQ